PLHRFESTIYRVQRHRPHAHQRKPPCVAIGTLAAGTGHAIAQDRHQFSRSSARLRSAGRRRLLRQRLLVNRSSEKNHVEIHSDVQGMRLALELAARGMFTTTPNPRVGCVIVKDARLIGAGYTQPAGQAHAEVQALNDAAAKGFDVTGATVYVTLEPCSHFGRTPPCLDAPVRTDVALVVCALRS